MGMAVNMVHSFTCTNVPGMFQVDLMRWFYNSGGWLSEEVVKHEVELQDGQQKKTQILSASQIRVIAIKS